MRTGDTVTLCLNYEINGSSLYSGGPYQEMEFQINKEGKDKSIKKLLSRGEIEYVTSLELTNGDTFTGYVVYLSQAETFELGTYFRCQLRVKKNNEVGASGVSDVSLGEALSRTVL